MSRKRTKPLVLGGKNGASCNEFLALLSEYVDGGVNPALCKEVESHLARCNPCQVVVDNIRKTITLYRDDEPCQVPSRFRSRLYATLRECWKKTDTNKRRPKAR